MSIIDTGATILQLLRHPAHIFGFAIGVDMVHHSILNHGFWFACYCASAVAASLPSNQSASTVTYGSLQCCHPTSELENLVLPEEKHDTEDNNDNREIHTCGVYMAPSTIPGAGLGIYAGHAFASGEVVTPGDLVVPIHDYEFHNHNRPSAKRFLWDM